MGFALEYGLLIPESFYSDENLLRFFGARRIKWVSNTDVHKMVDMRGLTWVPVRDDALPRSVSSGVSTGPDRPNRYIFASVSLTCSCASQISTPYSTPPADR